MFANSMDRNSAAGEPVAWASERAQSNWLLSWQANDRGPKAGRLIKAAGGGGGRSARGSGDFDAHTRQSGRSWSLSQKHKPAAWFEPEGLG